MPLTGFFHTEVWLNKSLQRMLNTAASWVGRTPSPQDVGKTTRQQISTVNQSTWMGPLQPLPDYAPQVIARQFDYNVGRNLFYTPRGEAAISFQLLRALADSCDLVRFAIETRKDQMCTMPFTFNPTDSDKEDKDNEDPRIAELKLFFSRPDKINSWRSWLRQMLEEVFVTDSLSIYRQKTRGGQPYALELLDGSTIFPLVDDSGRTPLPPDPAYQQILKGVPKANYDTTEFLYAPYNKRVFDIYGYSVVEQVINAAQTEIERMKSQLAYFTAGSYPDAYVVGPDGMSPDKVLAWEKRINDMLSGNLAGRRQMPFMVHGTEVKEIKAPALKDDFDEWLARKICYAFSLPPTAFTKQTNRATAESEQDRALQEGLMPLMQFIKEQIDYIVQVDFGYADLEFSWSDTQDVDPSVQATVDSTDIKAGVRSINEVRADRGLPPVQGGDEPMALGAAGWIPLPGSKLDVQMKAEAQAQQEKQDQQNQANTEADRAHQVNLMQIKAKAGATDDDTDPDASPIGKRDTKKKVRVRRLEAPSLDRKEFKDAQARIAAAARQALKEAKEKATSALRQAATKLAKDHDEWEEVGDEAAEALAGAGLAQEIKDSLGALHSDAAQNTLAQVGVPNIGEFTKPLNRAGQKWADAHAGDMIEGLSDTTRDRVRDMIAGGLKDGLSFGDIADKLQDSWAFSDARADLIAVTEAQIANGQGQLEGFKQAKAAGVNLKKEWIPDPEPCEDCQANADQGPIDVEDDFQSGDDAEPAHPNCQCYTQGVIIEDDDDSEDNEE